MKSTYRRTQRSFLEQAFARLFKFSPAPTATAIRLDLINGVDLDFRKE